VWAAPAGCTAAARALVIPTLITAGAADGREPWSIGSKAKGWTAATTSGGAHRAWAQKKRGLLPWSGKTAGAEIPSSRVLRAPC